MEGKKEMPMKDDNGLPLFTWPSDNPQLIGSKCKVCGEVVFPKRTQCPKCHTETEVEVLLCRRGKVYCSSITYIAPWTMYKGPVPYSVGHVELPERVLIPTRFPLDPGGQPLPIGSEVELAVEEWGEDEEGNMVMMHVFRSV